MNNKKTIWLDITNVPHVNFLLPIINKYSDKYNFIYSIRDFAETKGLFEKRIKKPYFEIGKHLGGNKFKKIYGSFIRIFELQKQIPAFDVKISIGGDASSIVAKLRGKLSITFDDNEKAPNWRYSPFSDFAFWPAAISKTVLKKQRFKDNKLYQYNGYKEDMYLADYVPDPNFLDILPFTDFVVVRPENISANYVEGNNSIVPELLKRLEELNYNILYLPRYDHDRNYALGVKNIFIPNGAINGMDACYYSKAILTGAGTMAREAACLGVPSVSFFAGDTLLTVDSKLISESKMYFSRNVDNIIEYLKYAKRLTANLDRCKTVQNEILDKLDEILNNYFKTK